MAKINNPLIVTGSQEKPEQTKSVTITTNGTQDITPDSGKVLSKVTIITNVPSKPEQEKSVTITKNGTTEVTPDNASYALSKVTVTTNVKPTLQAKTITPTKSAQNVTPDSSYDGLSEVTVNAIPDNYIIPSGSQNITTNGTYDITNKASVVVAVPSSQPTLNAPSISISRDAVTINNPSTNGSFVTEYKIYLNGALLTTTKATVVLLSDWIKVQGTYSITVKASGTNFNDSAASNTVTYKYTVYNITTNLNHVTADSGNATTISILSPVVLTFTANTGYNLPDNVTVTGATSTWNKSNGTLTLDNPTGNVSVTVTGVAKSYTITPTLTNVTAASGNATSIATGETKTLTYTAASGYELPDSVTVTGATGVWNKANGTLTLSNPTTNVTFTIAGVAVPTLSTPVISLVNGTTIQIDTIDSNAQTIEVYADGTKIGEVSKQ